MSIDGDNKVVITPGGSAMKVVRRLQSWWLELRRSGASLEPALTRMTVVKSSVFAKQLPTAVEHDEEMLSARPVASSCSLDPSLSDAHPEVDAHAQVEQPRPGRHE